MHRPEQPPRAPAAPGQHLGAVQAGAQVETLPRAEVRRCFERRFIAERMAR